MIFTNDEMLLPYVFEISYLLFLGTVFLYNKMSMEIHIHVYHSLFEVETRHNFCS